ncbi:hypothetical protein FOI42_RS02665 [Escherichia coli]|nr:hypothetical protein [Escherichia coli]EFL4883480.1 hypothetical protein [Escherichia coli]MED6699205.1 hypothetical protein [Escherichia coli O157]HCQ0858778.1 hypothetical protein [Escherichia coli]
MNLDVVKSLTEALQKNEVQCQELRDTIKVEYARLQGMLQESEWVVTKSIEGIYKDIESMFNKKSKIESDSFNKRKELNAVLGI